jgi:17beta-estradiol 17-dehydrogenase / very-long-chain 3-oxoacyl-CoA reductase
MALEFARKGLNVVIISRTLSKLEEFQGEIINKYPNIEVKILDIDFGNFDEVKRERVSQLINGLDIGCLVNNVGISYPYTQYFHELTNERVDQLSKLNIDSTTWMTRIVLPNMLARKAGSIVNISSGNL